MLNKGRMSGIHARTIATAGSSPESVVASTPSYVISVKSRLGSNVCRYMVMAQVLPQMSASRDQQGKIESSAMCTHPTPMLSKAITASFLRQAIRNLYRYGMGNAMITASVMRLTIPIEK